MEVLVHKITKPTAWRGRGQILKKEEEDAKLSARSEDKRQECAKHWQCVKEVQDVKNKPWRNEELKKLEEDTRDPEKAAKPCKAKTGVGCDGFHTSKFPWV